MSAACAIGAKAAPANPAKAAMTETNLLAEAGI
jgi:hypothetical protein